MLYFIAGLALIAAGIVMLAKPRLFFELTESWKHDGGAEEPSKAWLFSTRFGGVMCVLAGICGVIVPFLPH